MGAIFLLSFSALLIAAILLAWQLGDRLDREILFAICAAATGTAMAHHVFDGLTALSFVTLIDLWLFGIVFECALASRKYWPIWFAGIQGLVLTLDAAAIFIQLQTGFRFDMIAGVWAMVALLLMVIGLAADRSKMRRR